MKKVVAKLPLNGIGTDGYNVHDDWNEDGDWEPP